jgi:hypothetical protein
VVCSAVGSPFAAVCAVRPLHSLARHSLFLLLLLFCFSAFFLRSLSKVYGCDIEVDADVTGFRARLHECNIGPDMSPHSPRDRDLKREVTWRSSSSFAVSFPLSPSCFFVFFVLLVLKISFFSCSSFVFVVFFFLLFSFFFLLSSFFFFLSLSSLLRAPAAALPAIFVSTLSLHLSSIPAHLPPCAWLLPAQIVTLLGRRWLPTLPASWAWMETFPLTTASTVRSFSTSDSSTTARLSVCLSIRLRAPEQRFCPSCFAHVSCQMSTRRSVSWTRCSTSGCQSTR